MHHQDYLFNFEFSTGTVNCSLSTNVSIPCHYSLDEQVCRISKLKSLPSYILPELRQHLGDFIHEKTAEFERKNTPEITIADDASAIESLAKSIQDLHTKEVLAYAGPNTTSTEELCADIYGQVVRSAALDAMLTLEQTASGEMAACVEQRDRELAELAARHGADMDLAVASRSPEHVNALAAQQFDDSQLVQSRWESHLLTLRQTQRENFWNWLTGVHERVQLGDTDIPRPVAPPTSAQSEPVPPPPPPALEESFTIHLGTQLKQMYNLRLLAADVLQPFSYRGSSNEVDPRRIQTAMDLYSNSLSGLVLLVDNRINSYTGLKKEFAGLVSRATELHFPALDSQLEEIRNTVPEVCAWRAARRPAAPLGEAEERPAAAQAQMRPGDMYLTRHSNLAAGHLAYHIVTDDTLRGDINSRHPVILALRNVLKVAFLGDVTTLSIPLLLSHEMSEEMTVAWCMKRVELVYKCVKGFMMEMVAWGGSETRTIHFIVPKAISEEVFSSVASMLPNIFRISNPLVVKSS
ncbi:protein C12orf4-like [Pollicipes pollicipes]|uniref:protein C12orf4-like n=1 Tax=Pollicipes pollicipes TaxID=41117 RepID=UPI001884CDD1|nr:protein C12orf4-like [Pollicipes pollicipes]XP_037084677.1 protein C12orf4-like [Pollicipes pollicipes]